MADPVVPQHGGQLRELAERFGIRGDTLIDFSASISPIPPSDALIDALCASIRSRRILTDYPDMDYRDLRQVIARYTGVPADSICVGNGVMPLLAAALEALNLRRCLVLTPAFSEYQRTLTACGVERRTFLLRDDEGFIFDSDAVLRELERSDVDSVLLANPHSPSGVTTPPDILRHLQQAASCLDVTLMVDEAFIDYLPAASLSSLASQSRNLVVLRSLTKFFALPGLRIGYAIAHPEVRHRMEDMLPLWPVDMLAATAARLVLEDAELVECTRIANALHRSWLTEQMIALGLSVHPGSANYLLIRLPDRLDGFEVWRRLIVEHGIVVRNCVNFEGLSGQHLRIAVRSRSENQSLVGALQVLT
jgi:threonine-phosphate decarboxylase